MTRLGSKDGLAALLFIALGLFVILIGSTYEVGTPRRMGPGFFPVSVGVLLVIFGLVLGISAERTTERPVWEFRGPIFVLSAVLLFALLLPDLGLVLTGIIIVAIALLADPPYQPGRVALIAVGLSAGVTLLFVGLLNMTVPVWPEVW